MKVRLELLVLIKKNLYAFLKYFLLISIRTASLTQEKQGGPYQNKVWILASLSFKGQATKHVATSTF